MNNKPQRAFTANEVLAVSWQMVKKHWPQYLIILLLLVFFFIISMVIDTALRSANTPGSVSTLLSAIFGAYMSIVMVKGTLSIARTKKLVVAEILKIDGKMYLHAFLAMALLQLVVVMGLIFLIIPGIIFALMFGYSLYSVVDVGTDVLTSFKDSASLTKGSGWELFFFQILLGFVSFFALLIPAIIWGVVITGADGFSWGNLGPMIILAIITGLIVAVVAVVVTMLSMAGQAYMYLKMREHSPAPKA